MRTETEIFEADLQRHRIARLEREIANGEAHRELLLQTIDSTERRLMEMKAELCRLQSASVA